VEPTIVPLLDEIARDPSRARGLSGPALVALALKATAAQSAIAQAQAELLLASPQHVASADAGEDRLLTVAEAAAMLNVPRPWLYRRHKRLGLAVKLADNTLRFYHARLQALMKQPTNSRSRGARSS
jgi:predicted DNA-binding transcriptional regulator AlpA